MTDSLIPLILPLWQDFSTGPAAQCLPNDQSHTGMDQVGDFPSFLQPSDLSPGTDTGTLLEMPWGNRVPSPAQS